MHSVCRAVKRSNAHRGCAVRMPMANNASSGNSARHKIYEAAIPIARSAYMYFYFPSTFLRSSRADYKTLDTVTAWQQAAHTIKLC